MVWHIFKKDWKLLWLFVVIVASLHSVSAFIIFKLGLFGESAMFTMLAQTVPMLSFFASAFLIAAIVHVDAIPGVRQDWLVRPIRRRDLLLEKFLFVLFMVEGPIFLTNLFQGLANGFSFRSTVLSTTSYVIFLIFFVTLPVFTFASVTRNMTEAFIFGCGCAFVIGASLTFIGYANGYWHGILVPIPYSGIAWIGEVFRFLLVAVAASLILGLQYFRRKTAVGRFLLVCSVLVILASQFLPWKPAFAIEQRLSSKRAVGASTVIAFDPAKGKFKSPSGILPRSERVQREGEDSAEVFLPLQVTGIQHDSMLLTDRVEAQLIGQDGRIAYHGVADSLEVAREGSNPLEGPIYQQIAVPISVYQGTKDEKVEVRLEYSLTLFSLARSYSIPALNGDERMPEWGWCRTRVNEAGTAIELQCMNTLKGPACGSAFVENPSTGARNPSRSSCRSDYSPYGYHPLPDSLVRFGTNLPFRDPSGLANFPVDGSQLPKSHVVVRVYEPEDHFTRSLVIPQIELKEWETR